MQTDLQPEPIDGPITILHRVGREQEESVAITVQPVTESFAAEIGDVDLARPIAADATAVSSWSWFSRPA